MLFGGDMMIQPRLKAGVCLNLEIKTDLPPTTLNIAKALVGSQRIEIFGLVFVQKNSGSSRRTFAPCLLNCMI
jgi:hypothetical protein